MNKNNYSSYKLKMKIKNKQFEIPDNVENSQNVVAKFHSFGLQ